MDNINWDDFNRDFNNYLREKGEVTTGHDPIEWEDLNDDIMDFIREEENIFTF